MNNTGLVDFNSQGQQGTAAAERPHIVVVDDDPTMRDILSRYLTHCGFDVSTCGSSDDVSMVLRCTVVDILITDLASPEDSARVIRSVRGINTDLPIIVINGRPMSETEQAFIDMNVTEVFEKPTRLDDLAQTASTIARSKGSAPRF